MDPAPSGSGSNPRTSKVVAMPSAVARAWTWVRIMPERSPIRSSPGLRFSATLATTVRGCERGTE